MPGLPHDPLSFAAGLSSKLASRSRHVCVLLGAGASCACGLPDLPQLETRVLAHLEETERELLRRQLQGRDLEEALSRIRRIAVLLSGGQELDGLTAEDAVRLDLSVCQAVVSSLDVADADLAPMYYLAAWAGRADYRLPVELFTVNYDLLLERALDQLKVPYFDGFVGNLRARFHPELVDSNSPHPREQMPPSFVRLWKLHGSTNWAWEAGREVVRVGSPVPDGTAAAIYPSDRKYEESRRVPFLVLQDHLARTLHQPETLVLITGYSFRDDHLNEVVFNAAARRPRSEFVIFCYSGLPDGVAAQAQRTPNMQLVGGEEAILGGLRARWEVPSGDQPNVWESGSFVLRDFKHLSAFLGRNATREPDAVQALQDLIRTASADGKGAENA